MEALALTPIPARVRRNMQPIDIARFILKKEGRFDSDGHLEVYTLPKGDGGGKFEIAGINDRYHPEEAAALRDLIRSEKFDEAELRAARYLVDYTGQVKTWHPDIRVRAFLRDCAFNRGKGGAAKMLQHSLRVAGSYKGILDGGVGTKTKRAAKKHEAEDLLPRLLLSRQWYERAVAKRSERSKFWPGLTNRWVDAYQFATGMGDPYEMFR